MSGSRLSSDDIAELMTTKGLLCFSSERLKDVGKELNDVSDEYRWCVAEGDSNVDKGEVVDVKKE